MRTAAFILFTELTPTTILVVAIVTIVFVAVLIANIISIRRFRRKSESTRNVSRIMQHALELEKVKVVRVKMAQKVIVNVYDDLLPEEGVSTEKYMENVHPDDRHKLSRFMTQISLGKEESGECHYRSKYQDKDGNWKWRYVSNNAVKTGRSIPFDIICTLNDESADMQQQQQEEDLSRRYRSIFERSVVGLAIFDEKGMLLVANENMQQAMHMEGERDPYYWSVSLFRRQPFRDLIMPGESTELYFCTKMVVPERHLNSFMEVQLRPLLDDAGRVLHYSLAVQNVTDERNFYLKNRENDEQLRQAYERIQRYETELQYLMDRCDMRAWKVTFNPQEVTIYKGLNSYDRKLSLAELRSFFIDNQEAVTKRFEHPEQYFCRPVSMVRRTRSIFHDQDEIHWNIIDSIPIFDDNGNLESCFGIIRNITPLIQAQELLKEETRRANDSTRLKSVFMANMTHEIRTPLNSIVGFSDLLPMIESPEEKKEMIRVIMNNCDMLLRLINDILEISTMDGNAIIITPEEVDFSKVFDDICESLEQRVQCSASPLGSSQTPAVQFIKDNPYPTLRLSVDQRRVQQVITNFVTNAIKYTQQGYIKVGYRISPIPSEGEESREGLYIYCEDTGTGIPKEKQKTVFDRFVKLNDYVQGTGLGLSICKAIATRCGGQIGVESEGEGHGSTFWIRIPI